MKILMVSTTDSMMWNFLIPHINYWKSQGDSVDIACAETGFYFKELKEKYHFSMYKIPFSRSPFKLTNFKAAHCLNDLVKNKKYDVIVTQEPVGGVIGRLIAKLNHVKNIYTAHGFHFYKNAPLLNWVLYYPIECIMAHFTDLIITLNQEDYERSKRFKCLRRLKMDGIGVDLQHFKKNMLSPNLKSELGIFDDRIVVLTVAEMIPRKNYAAALKTIKLLNSDRFVYLVCGDGRLKQDLHAMVADLGIQEQVKFLGFRKDINEIYKISDLFLFPSFQEGLSIALIEAMASGLPIVCSKIRGNTDLIQDNLGGYLYSPTDFKGMAAGISEIVNNPENNFGQFNKEYVKKFGIEKSINDFYTAIKSVF